MDQMIALDIGGAAERETRYFSLFLKLSYQWTFAVAFLLSVLPLVGIDSTITPGPFLGTLLAKLYMAVFWGRKAIPPNFDVRMNYPYMYLWGKIFYNLATRKSEGLLSGYEPSVPVCFIYGKDKPFMFHGPKYASIDDEGGN